MQLVESTALCLTLVALASAASGEPANKPRSMRESEARRWVLNLPDRTMNWLKTIQRERKPGEPWGLFTFCRDSRIPYSVVSTNIVWAYADLCGGIEKMPGYHPKAKEEMAAWVQGLQDPKSRQFIDPLLESCVPNIDDPKVRYTFREAVSK